MANLFGTLTLLLSFLILVIALLAAVVSLVSGHARFALRIGQGVLAWIAVYALLLVFVSLTSPRQILDPGQEHCFDEMCFSVQGVSTTCTLGPSETQVTAQGVYYVVSLNLRNAARGTAQKPSVTNFWVAGDQGRRYQPLTAGSDTPGQPLDVSHLWDQKLQPGEHQVHTLAFDLPEKMSNPALFLTEGAGITALIIGDENSPLHPITGFRLNPSPTGQ
jgi:hypothetical protein